MSEKTMPVWHPDPNVETAAVHLGFGKCKSYQDAKKGRIPGATKLGGKWIVRKAPFFRFLEDD